MAPPTIVPAPTEPTPPATGHPKQLSPSDILRAAGDLGIGTHGAHVVSGQLNRMAQEAREKGRQFSQALTNHANALDELCKRTQSIRGESWKSQAGKKYQEKLEEYRKNTEHSRDELRTAADEALQAGEEVAHMLESQSAAITNAAGGVDTIIHGLTHGAADLLDNTSIEDIVVHSGVLDMQGSLNNLISGGQDLLRHFGAGGSAETGAGDGGSF